MTARSRSRLARRLLGTGALAAGLLAAGTGVAAAHVTVSAPEATPGGSYAKITFRVPTESDTARTVGVKVRMPVETPIPSVLVQPKAGWSVTVSERKLATPIKTEEGEITQVASEVEWKASGGGQGIGPGQFDEFVLIASKLPETRSVTFKAIQAYSDGSTVSWIEEPAPGSSVEPEHPAPVLTFGGGSGHDPASSGGASEPASSPTATAAPAPPAASGAAGAASTGSAGPAAKGAEAAASTPDDTASKTSAVAGIILGGLGVLLGMAALAVAMRRRRPDALA